MAEIVENIDDGLIPLADHLRSRREAILREWRRSISRDPSLLSGDSLPNEDLYDHIPALLTSFERLLRNSPREAGVKSDVVQAQAAAHGLQRWQQGYDLREVTRELGKLNEIFVLEIESCRREHAVAAGVANRLWASLYCTSIEESVAQFFQLQQREAVGHLKDLETALEDVRQLEKQRSDLWRHAAHDLRGNLSVVANATASLSQSDLREPVRDTFVRILMRNVTSLHQLLNDVTDLARLQAGNEQRRVGPVDVSALMHHLCDGVRPVAQERHLFLRCSGPEAFAVEGDEVKIRRIAQNLILNAVKFTRDGGITVTWGDIYGSDSKRWKLCVTDTGPGFHAGSGQPLAQALRKGDAPTLADSPVPMNADSAGATVAGAPSTSDPTGEGLGLSIVKRLCDLLDATIEMTSQTGVGTRFDVFLPRHYS